MHRRPFHLVVVISGHGFGHAAMTAPILNALHQYAPQIQITLRSLAPRWFFEQYYRCPFHYLEEGCDFGMVMQDAFTVDLTTSRHSYNEFHRCWPERVRAEEVRLKELGADLLLSNIAYLPLTAARNIGIPAIAYGCLNWADIYRHYFCADEIHHTMMAAYNSADIFLRPTPSMPMPEIQTQAIGPVAVTAIDRREEIKRRLNLRPETQLVLASLGGVNTHLDNRHWPHLADTHYLLPQSPTCPRNDLSSLAQAGVSFSDAIASCSLFITKPGYGAFTETACNGVPVLYAKRNWPEQPYLANWLRQRLPCAEITPQQLQTGAFTSPLRRLLNAARPCPVNSNGAEEALQTLRNFIDQYAPH